MHIPSSILLSSLTALFSLSHAIRAHDTKHATSAAAAAAEAPLPPTEIETLKPQFFPQYKSQRINVKYGPYLVPSMHTDNGMIYFGGEAVSPPCTDCLITYMHASLTYPNNTRADASTGMWLHHTVWTNLAHPDPHCPGRRHGDRFFASGNERTPIDLTHGGAVRAGYAIESGDVLVMGGEVMNMWAEEREVSVGVVFEFIPSVPRGFRRVRSYWLDVGGCNGSSVPAMEERKFKYVSPAVEVQEGGDVVFTASHLHDGGTHAEIKRNGNVVCDSVASYGMCGHKGEEEGDEHIEALSACTDLGRTEKGDEWSVTAHYDTKAHAPMRNMDGSLEGVMGISLVYVAVGEGEKRAGHKKLKIFLGLAIFTLSAVLVVMWANLHGRDWRGRRKAGVMLGEDGDGKGAWSALLGGRYRDEE